MTRLSKAIRNMLRDERGAVSPFMLVILFGLIVSTGLGIDLLKHESERARLQSALDRGVLAAASLSQLNEAEGVVSSYLRSSLEFAEQVDLDVQVENSQTRRSITAEARYVSNTMFLRLIGADRLTVPARAKAEQGRRKVEIALVLDRSGSMGEDPTKIASLRIAAVEFLNIIEGKYVPENVAITMIPFSGNVAAGNTVANFLGVPRWDPNQSCLRFRPEDYETSSLPEPAGFSQPPNGTIEPCPGEANSITFLSNDFDAMRDEAEALVAAGRTGTYYAMKWAVGMLDPATRLDEIYPVAVGDPVSFTDQLILNGLAPPEASILPAAWEDTETLKAIVVMTDGIIVPAWDAAGNLDPEVDVAVDWFLGLCDIARGRDVLVYTVAFQAPETAADQMRQCASEPSTFFDVQGTDLVAAFERIAEDISKLRLTQ